MTWLLTLYSWKRLVGSCCMAWLLTVVKKRLVLKALRQVSLVSNNANKAEAWCLDNLCYLWNHPLSGIQITWPLVELIRKALCPVFLNNQCKSDEYNYWIISSSYACISKIWNREGMKIPVLLRSHFLRRNCSGWDKKLCWCLPYVVVLCLVCTKRSVGNKAANSWEVII